MRLATYNVEWFSRLFNHKNRLLLDQEWSSRYNVTRKAQIDALGVVFQMLDADAIMVVEAPDSSRRHSSTVALENFAAHFNLRQNKAVTGFENETQQEITLLYDPRFLEAVHDPKGEISLHKGSTETPRFDGEFHLDVDIDALPDPISFSKPPLEIVLTPKDGSPIRLIGVHVKSKAPHGARTPHDAVRLSIENRRKQLAQCIWLRRRVEQHLDQGEDVIVLGDFNDGPGLDEYEKLFGQSGLEIVLGCSGPVERMLTDPNAMAIIRPRPGPSPTSARFFVHPQKRYMNALLDYVMISKALVERTAPTWKIWHPFDDPGCFENPIIREALLTASDHFPVTVDMNISPSG